MLNDAEAGPNWLPAAADVLADPGVVGVTPKVVLAGRYAEWVVLHAGSFLLRHGIAGEYGYGATADGRFDRRWECFSATVPVPSARGLRRVGPLAGACFAHNEDTDWCLRARGAGWRVVYDPAAAVVHRLSASSGGPANEGVRHLSERNALLCLLRNALDPLSPRASSPAYAGDRATRSARTFLAGPPGAGHPGRHAAPPPGRTPTAVGPMGRPGRIVGRHSGAAVRRAPLLYLSTWQLSAWEKRSPVDRRSGPGPTHQRTKVVPHH